MRTVVTREPEWDHAEVAKLQAFAEYEAGLCACGLHQSIADTDPDLDMPERKCPVCAGLARNWRAIHHADEEATRALGERAKDPLTPLPGDGRHFTLAMRSVAGEVPGDQSSPTEPGQKHRHGNEVR